VNGSLRAQAKPLCAIQAMNAAPDFLSPVATARCRRASRNGNGDWLIQSARTCCCRCCPVASTRFSPQCGGGSLPWGSSPGYAELYRRAKAIADARISAVVSPDPLHTRIAAHAWLCTDAGSQRIANAVLTMGVIRTQPGDPKPEGEPALTPEQWTAAGGMTRESLATELAGSTPLDEILQRLRLARPLIRRSRDLPLLIWRVRAFEP